VGRRDSPIFALFYCSPGSFPGRKTFSFSFRAKRAFKPLDSRFGFIHQAKQAQPEQVSVLTVHFQVLIFLVSGTHDHLGTGIAGRYA
jgi:hypothetical protein